MTKEDMEYPKCFTSHEKCITCPNFGQECTDKINEIDMKRYINGEL